MVARVVPSGQLQREPSTMALTPKHKTPPPPRAFEEHNAVVARVVPSGQLHEACSWDDNYHWAEGALRALGYTRCGGRKPQDSNPKP